ncbi:MAG: SET domain-containing protein [Ferrimicrobium acidiphilum]
MSGRGVFATRSFRCGDLIEACPVIVIPAAERSDIDKTILFNYYYDWDGDAALAQGLGSFYNHSYKPNATYEKDIPSAVIRVVAIRDITVAEEITVNYNGSPDSTKPVWFETDTEK